MDGHRFDELTRALAARRTRRGLLTGLAALGTGLVGGRAAPARAACPPDQVNRRGGCVCKTTGRPPNGAGCPCPNGQIRCGDVCVDLARDGANCGECGVVCGADERCRGGTCVCIDNGQACVGKTCDTAITNCGKTVICGPLNGACPSGQSCETGVCTCTATACPEGCCDGNDGCRIDDDTACGTGGGACTACSGTGETCGGGGVDGVCGCTDDRTACGTAVCGTATNNCGDEVACGPLDGACPQVPGQVCTEDGRCVCTSQSCPDGCCDDSEQCRIDEDLACGTGGGICTPCSGTGVTCGGGGTPGVCGCTPLGCTAETCGREIVDGCGGTVTCPDCQQTFGLVRAAQPWTVPTGVTRVTFDAFGAQGGGHSLAFGGQGARATATIVPPATSYQIVVGGMPLEMSAAGGFNGGGDGTGHPFGSRSSSAGGGASDVRTGAGLETRILVAGGGGGSGWTPGGGGYGGQTGQDGVIGGDGTNYTPAGGGGGASQSAGGSAGTAATEGHAGTAGQLGQGGAGGAATGQSITAGGGGGGGYYGGGGGGSGGLGGGSGGGGSSFGPTGTVYEPGVQGRNGQVIVTYRFY